MSIAFVFWFLMLVWLIFGLVRDWPAGSGFPMPIGGHLLQFILFCLVGYQVFGSPLK
jgi:hypothetical protein